MKKVLSILLITSLIPLYGNSIAEQNVVSRKVNINVKIENVQDVIALAQYLTTLEPELYQKEIGDDAVKAALIDGFKQDLKNAIHDSQFKVNLEEVLAIARSLRPVVEGYNVGDVSMTNIILRTSEVAKNIESVQLAGKIHSFLTTVEGQALLQKLEECSAQGIKQLPWLLVALYSLEETVFVVQAYLATQVQAQ